jgi:hypothetical protein
MTDNKVELPSDEELLRRAVLNFRPRIKRGFGGVPRWAAVMHLFSLGSGYSQHLCVRLGLDPDELVRKP